jgi:hypothetical protein
MNREEILKRLENLANEGSHEVCAKTKLAATLLEVIEAEFGNMSDQSVDSIFFVAASLIKDHANAVEQDILTVRDIFRSR